MESLIKFSSTCRPSSAHWSIFLCAHWWKPPMSTLELNSWTMNSRSLAEKYLTWTYKSINKSNWDPVITGIPGELNNLLFEFNGNAVSNLKSKDLIKSIFEQFKHIWLQLTVPLVLGNHTAKSCKNILLVVKNSQRVK